MLTTFANIFMSVIDKHAPLKTKKIRRNQALTKHQLNCYCPVAIMKKFAHIMLHYHWRRRLRRWANIFRYM